MDGGHRRGDRMAAAGIRPAARQKTQLGCQRCSLAANPSSYDSFHTHAPGQLRNGGRGLRRPAGSGKEPAWVGGGRPWRRADAAVGL